MSKFPKFESHDKASCCLCGRGLVTAAEALISPDERMLLTVLQLFAPDQPLGA